ncbi:GlxA family transcriptional regulator [Nonomuraea typhae]|uniref:GlxA family transcriptional regulator n=1 Tax=Nonomuraea typhae TaxID=2603600 RepID=UPI0012F9E886|nr:helix-turn-helix domain-containing protein [Nonomuraea typhae]
MGRIRVVVPVLDDCPLFELAVPCEVFGRDRRDLSPGWYELTVCQSASGEQEALVEGLWLRARRGLEAIAGADLVVVPACSDGSYRPPPQLLEALAEAHRRGARIASLCSGAFVLAAAGLLEGREVATHWMHAEELARRHPRVRVNPRALYVDDGDILTSAGTAAGIDLCLHIVRTDFGAAVAAEVGRRMVIAPQREGDQAQYATSPAPPPGHGGLAPVLEWARERLHEPLTVPQLAERAMMSTRHFVRRFHQEIGVPPIRWLTHQRVARARELLETTRLPVEAVAERAGFGTGGGLRQHFTKAVGTTPSAYRRTYQG